MKNFLPQCGSPGCCRVKNNERKELPAGSSFLLTYRMICISQQRWHWAILRLCFFQKRTEKLGKSPTHSPAFRRIIGVEMRNIRTRPEKEDKKHEDKNI